MLSIFRTNQLAVSLLLLFFLAGLWAHTFVFPADWVAPDHGWLSKVVYGWIGKQSWLAKVIAILLLFIQAALINLIAMGHRLDREINMYPGLFFVIFCSIIPGLLGLSPVHMGNLFILLALMNLLNAYKKPNVADSIFNIGLWIGVASLFYQPFLAFILFAFIGLQILRAYKFSERIILLSGVFVPYFLLGTYFFFIGHLDSFIDLQFSPFGKFKWLTQPLGLDLVLQLGIIFILLVVIIFSYGMHTSKKGIDVQKKIDIFYWMMFIAVLSFVVFPRLILDQLLLMAIPFGTLLALSFSSLANRWAESWFFILLLLVLLFQYYPLLV